MRLPPVLSKVSSLATSAGADASVDQLGNMLGLDEIGDDHVRLVVGCTDKAIRNRLRDAWRRRQYQSDCRFDEFPADLLTGEPLGTARFRP
jgi:hypothetical protein